MDGRDDQRQNCGCSMCTIEKGKCHIFGVDHFGMLLRSSCVSHYMLFE